MPVAELEVLATNQPSSSLPNYEKADELPPELERYLALVKRIYERMEHEGFPWEDKGNG